MKALARLARRITYLHGVCAFAWLLGVVTSLAVTDIESVSAADSLANGARLAILFAVCVAVAHRLRDAMNELHDAFVRSHAHLFVMGLLALVVVACVGSMLLTRQVRFAVFLGPNLIFAQAALSLFCCAGRGFDRMACLGLWMVFLQGGTGNPHDRWFGAGYLAATCGGLAFSHFHALMVRHGSEERPLVPGALGFGLLCASLVLLGYAGLYAGVPRTYGMSTEYVEPTVGHLPYGAHGPRIGEEPDGPQGSESSLAHRLINAATAAGGLALAWLLWRALRRGGRRSGAGDEAEDEAEATTIVEDLPAEPAAPRHKHRGSSPRAQVILAYQSLSDKLKAHGIERQVSQTPTEFAAEVARRAERGAEPMRQLSEVFARAKYSLGSITEEDAAATAKWAAEVVAGAVLGR